MKKPVVHMVWNADFYGTIEVSFFKVPKGTYVSNCIALCKQSTGKVFATSDGSKVTCRKCLSMGWVTEEFGDPLPQRKKS